MNILFMASGNSKTSDSTRQLLYLLDKINLKKNAKYVTLSNLSIYCTWKNMKHSSINNNFKILDPTWSNKFELPDGSQCVLDIQNYFE